MRNVIEVNSLGKLYRLGKIGTGTLSHDLKRWWALTRGKDDPYTKIGTVNDRTKKGEENEYVWALREISFSVKQGDVVGVIGKNGAGKSTLLKILSRITSPTVGDVKIKGRIGALLEVGTGFHPEMSGRENIYMNGTILGMRRHEIANKFDEIVDFAGVAKYIDTPVKRYSSGMMVRLGFAVAAHLDPEILIVDEVLAVGDADFQNKAIGKMQDVSNSEGRTVLFVSHNMSAVSSLCKSSIVLQNGTVVYQDTADKGIDFYLNNIIRNRTKVTFEGKNRPGDEVARLNGAKIISENGHEVTAVDVNETFGIEIDFEVFDGNTRLYPNVHFFSKKNEYLFVSSIASNDLEIKEKGRYLSTVWVPKNLLNEGGFYAGIAVSSVNPTRVHFNEKEALVFDIVEENYHNRSNGYVNKLPGFFRPALNWELNKTTNL